MGKRRYRQPYRWFNTRLEHMPAGSFRHMFLRLSARQANPLHAVPSPSQSVTEAHGTRRPANMLESFFVIRSLTAVEVDIDLRVPKFFGEF
jgi:hypothetical protein